jgi:hypothetical protein
MPILNNETPCSVHIHSCRLQLCPTKLTLRWDTSIPAVPVGHGRKRLQVAGNLWGVRNGSLPTAYLLLVSRVDLEKVAHFACDKLTPWITVLPDNLTSPQLLEKISAFYGTRRFITAFTRARLLSVSAVADSRHGSVLQLGGWARCYQLLTVNNYLGLGLFLWWYVIQISWLQNKSTSRFSGSPENAVRFDRYSKTFW